MRTKSITKQTSMGHFFSTLAKSLQLPIAVLPVAGLLLRLGQDDLLGNFGIYGQFLASGANTIFAQLPLIFAIAVAMGFSKDGNGSAALSGGVAYLVLTGCLSKLAPSVNIGILGGIVSGVGAGVLYNKYCAVQLPPYLAFFGGRRFVPIVSSGFAVVLSLVFSFVWPGIQLGVDSFAKWMTDSGNLGLFLYGFCNRMLLPVGLHMILNTIVWFQFGSFTGPSGTTVTGEIARYLASDPTAGYFMSGFFPVMMFGLPAACLAMLHAVPKNNRSTMVGIFLSMALTSILTGVTEPIEFAFMFLAFPLYITHAVLTGLSLVIMHLLRVRLGFTFSAGIIDLFLNARYGAQTQDVALFGSALGGYGNVVWAILIGIVYATLYYILFSCIIRLCNLTTPGRESSLENPQKQTITYANGKTDLYAKAEKIYQALGGSNNIKSIDACATRLRLEVVDNSVVNEQALKDAGVIGVVNKIAGNCQVIIGMEAGDISDIIKNLLS